MEESIIDFTADLKALIVKYNITLKEHDIYIQDEWKSSYYSVVVNGKDTALTVYELLDCL